MLKELTTSEGKILDPACGAGNLLAAAIIAGIDPKQVFGIEINPKTLEICRERLSKLGVPKYNLHLGNALNPACYYNFTESYFYDIKTDQVFDIKKDSE